MAQASVTYASRGRPCCLQVAATETIRATISLPASDCVPKLPFRQSTAGRSARSAALLDGQRDRAVDEQTQPRVDLRRRVAQQRKSDLDDHVDYAHELPLWHPWPLVLPVQHPERVEVPVAGALSLRPDQR